MFCCYQCAVMCCPYNHSLPCTSLFRHERSFPPALARPSRRMSRQEFRNAIQRCYEWFYVWTMDGMSDGYYEFGGVTTDGEDFIVTLNGKIFGYSDVYSIRCFSKTEAEKLKLTTPSGGGIEAPGEIITPPQQGPAPPQQAEYPWGYPTGGGPGTGGIKPPWPGSQSGTPGGVQVPSQSPGQEPEAPWGESGWPGQSPEAGGNQPDTHGSQPPCPDSQPGYPHGGMQAPGQSTGGVSTGDWPLD